MKNLSPTLAAMLLRLAGSCRAGDLTLEFQPHPDEHRGVLDAVRAALPDLSLCDDEIVCLSCFVTKRGETGQLFSARSVEREMARRGYDRDATLQLIDSLRAKHLIEIPHLLREPEDGGSHTVVCAPGVRERMRVAPALAARLRLPAGATASGFASIREHLDACLAWVELLRRARVQGGRRGRGSASGDDGESHRCTRSELEDRARETEHGIRLRESVTREPTPLMRIVRRLGLDEHERIMLLYALRCALQRESCELRDLEDLLRGDRQEDADRRKYFSFVAPLFYHAVLLPCDTPVPFDRRADVTVQDAVREWLVTGEGDPLRDVTAPGSAAGDPPYASNREQMTDWLRYIGARRREQRPPRRGRHGDGDAIPLYAAGRIDERLRRRFLEIERHIVARCAASPARFPLQRIVERCQLSIDERDVLLLLLERELCGQDTEVRDVIAFFGGDAFTGQRYRRLFRQDAAMLRCGLVTVESRAAFDRAEVALTPETREELIGEDGDEPPKRAPALLGPRSMFSLETVPQRLADVVLPPGIEQTLRTAVARYEANADALLSSWGFTRGECDGDVAHHDASLRLLFSGPPGTGKTYAAGALATDLGRELLATDVSRILSCWVGESEKNVRALFDDYERIAGRSARPPVLLLNECDQFLGRRGAQARSSVDRMYHQMQNLFLERIERFAGILVATTNLVDAIDEAFSRRFHYKLVFPMPDAVARLGIWRRHFPPAMPLAEDVDLEELALRYAFSGGQIAVAVRNAAVAAAVRGDIVRMADFLAACRSEHDGAFEVAPRRERSIGFRVR